MADEIVETSKMVIDESQATLMLLQHSNLVLTHQAPRLHEALLESTFKVRTNQK